MNCIPFYFILLYFIAGVRTPCN